MNDAKLFVCFGGAHKRGETACCFFEPDLHQPIKNSRQVATSVYGILRLSLESKFEVTWLMHAENKYRTKPIAI